LIKVVVQKKKIVKLLIFDLEKKFLILDEKFQILRIKIMFILGDFIIIKLDEIQPKQENL
jgi:hypothetical protein